MSMLLAKISVADLACPPGRLTAPVVGQFKQCDDAALEIVWRVNFDWSRSL